MKKVRLFVFGTALTVGFLNILTNAHAATPTVAPAAATPVEKEGIKEVVCRSWCVDEKVTEGSEVKEFKLTPTKDDLEGSDQYFCAPTIEQNCGSVPVYKKAKALCPKGFLFLRVLCK